MFAFPPIVTFSLSVETFLPAETRHKMIAQKKLKTFSSRLSQGHYTIRDLKLEDAEIMKSFGLGRFKAVVETYTIEDGENKPVMSFDFLFHGE